jgi:hypothetical protein
MLHIIGLYNSHQGSSRDTVHRQHCSDRGEGEGISIMLMLLYVSREKTRGIEDVAMKFF